MNDKQQTESGGAVGCSALLACPFCDGVADIEEVPGMLGTRKSAGCITEGCQGYQSMLTFSTRREAAAAWNTRHEASDRQLLNELIRRNDLKLESNPTWTGHERLRGILYDAGKCIAEWDGRGQWV